MLKVKKLSLIKSRKKHSPTCILDDLTLEFPPARISLLLGKSGSGKTSLLRCLAQLENGYTGSIEYQGTDIKDWSPVERSKKIGFVSQSYSLFPHLTALENCSQALIVTGGMKKAEARKKATEVLLSLDMDKYLFSKPSELSGGQQQRVAIARALALEPSFLLFDEPTSALDPENSSLLIDIIEKLKADKKGLIISSQDLTFAEKIFDRIFFLEKGRLTEDHCFLDKEYRETKEGLEGTKLGKFLYGSLLTHA